MSEFCRYINCHNLGISKYQGYCDKQHMERGPEKELLMKIIEKNKDISTMKEARKFLVEYIRGQKRKDRK